ncbi:hypothetical protein DFJ73DRAFT_827976 [Zopfochytrium polystomum]|nr:hypothetical protein DFJ73DRAFT_827976 [Zopfochytrium polystomum]
MLNNTFVTVAPWIRTLSPLRHPRKLRTFVNGLAPWGVSLGLIALFFLEPTPIARRDIFQNIPVVGGFWRQKLEDRERKD